MKVKKLQKQIKKKSLLLNKITEEIKDLKAELIKTCNHKDNDTTYDYISGSYLNTARYEYKQICKTCGLILDTWTVNTNDYE